MCVLFTPYGLLFGIACWILSRKPARKKWLNIFYFLNLALIIGISMVDTVPTRKQIIDFPGWSFGLALFVNAALALSLVMFLSRNRK